MDGFLKFVGAVALAILAFVLFFWFVCNVCWTCGHSVGFQTNYDLDKECSTTETYAGKNKDGIPVYKLKPEC